MSVNRNLDGCYFRVIRFGEFKNVCFSDLSKSEREEICCDRTADWYKSLAYHLADSLRAIGDTFDITMEE